MCDIYPSQKQRGEELTLLGVKFSLCFGSKLTPHIIILAELEEHMHIQPGLIFSSKNNEVF